MVLPSVPLSRSSCSRTFFSPVQDGRRIHLTVVSFQPRHPVAFWKAEIKRSIKGTEEQKCLQRGLCYFLKSHLFMMSCNPGMERWTVLLGGTLCSKKVLTSGWEVCVLPLALPFPDSIAPGISLLLSGSQFLPSQSQRIGPAHLKAFHFDILCLKVWSFDFLPILPERSILVHVREK